jgi:hypothetical protein
MYQVLQEYALHLATPPQLVCSVMYKPIDPAFLDVLLLQLQLLDKYLQIYALINVLSVANMVILFMPLEGVLLHALKVLKHSLTM